MHAAPSWPTYDRLLRQRRSVRAYEDMAVPKPVLEAIVGESCLAPSSENRQPWRFIVITDRELMRRLSDESKTNLIRRMAEDQEAPAKGYASLLRDPDSNVFYNAPCLVLLAGSGNLRSVHVDCALAAGYLMWAAAARGLGTCLVGLGRAIEDPLLLEHIGLTPHECIVAPIIVGYPQKMPAMPDRRPPRITWVTAQDRPGTE